MTLREDAITAVDRYAEVTALETSEATATPLRTEIAALKARVVELEAVRQPAPTTPQPVPTTASKTLVGMSLGAGTGTDAQKLAQHEAAMGRIHVVRHYYSGNLPSWGSVKSLIGDRALVVSYKSADLAAAKAFAQAADVPTWMCVNHEPENDPGGATWATEYRRRMAALRDLVKSVGNPKVKACQILMGYTLDPASGRKLADFFVPGVVHGWDLYNAAWDKGQYTDPSQRFAKCVTASGTDGVAFAEWGSQLANGDTDGSRRAAWITATLAYHRKVNSEFTCYWQAWFGQGHPDFRLTDKPSQDAYRTAMAG